MQIDLKDVGSDNVLECDVCIVGGGIVGITLARQFIGTQTQVCLLESGGLDYESATQELYTGQNIGAEYYDLNDARLRFFGGSTLVWGGRCVPLDALDFEARSWVPYSGWPFSREELAPYYRAAHDHLELASQVHDERMWEELGAEPPAFDPRVLRTTFWHFDEAHSRFGWGNCRDLKRAKNIRVVTHANVTNIQASLDGSRIEHVDVATLDGLTTRVKGRTVVLATGGIENPRILLASNGVQQTGLGNDNDLVGRFFMEHPHGKAGEVFVKHGYELMRMYRKRRSSSGLMVAPILSPSDELQESAGILNSAIGIKYRRRPEILAKFSKRMYSVVKHQTNPTKTGRMVWRVYKKFKALRRARRDPRVRRKGLENGSHGLYVSIRGEQAPNPDSRVRLSSVKDALGVPQADLDWQMSSLDKQTVTVVTNALSSELERLGMGRVELSRWLSKEETAWPVDPTIGLHPIGGYHHMGTTRMADDAKSGVVDRNCRVHGIQNLYVGGSSVFPTTGWANPNLTIVALTLRLADHLKK